MQEILSKKDIGERIKKLRIKGGLSQAFVSDVLQLSRSNYSQIELGNQFPTFHTLHILARYYGKSYEWLLHGYQIQDNNRKSNPEPIPFPVLEPAISIMNADYQQQVSLVSEETRDLYFAEHRNAAFIRQLDTLTIPVDYSDPQNIYRAFRLTGLSLPSFLQADDILIGLQVSAYKNLILNNLYIIVTDNHICVARFLNINSSKDGLVFRNNNNSIDFIIRFSSVQEIWSAYGKFTMAVDPMVNEMELNLKRFEHTIRKLEKELNVMRSLKSV
ncbi:MAG: XRE family transcriptional regulator [Chryseobacterium sp.]|nr:MAG: XRE family transcriptional regulator [Chryseobacterium sp.]